MLSEKNYEALTYGPEYLLGKFVNLPQDPDDPKPAEKFRERFGDLYPGLAPEDYWEHVVGFRLAWIAEEKSGLQRVSDYIGGILNRSRLSDDIFVQIFKDACRARDEVMTSNPSLMKVDASSGDLVFEPGTLTSLLKMCAHHPLFKAVLTVDFSTGEHGVKGQTLLDCLALWLLKCRNRLAICERKECLHPYFVKSHIRQKFCSEDCAQVGRAAKKKVWWAKNRDRFIMKWRKQRKAARRLHRSTKASATRRKKGAASFQGTS